MAQLTNADLRSYLDAIMADATAKAELAAVVPPRQVLLVVMQAIEDTMTTAAIPAGAVGATMPQYLRGACNAAAGQTLTVVLVKKLFKVWMDRKFRSE